MKSLLFQLAILCPLFCSLTNKVSTQNSTYLPPTASAQVLKGIEWDKAKNVGSKFRSRFSECDNKDECDGKTLKYGCKKDLNKNSVLLQFPDGTIFFDAKMGLDADGSLISKKKLGTNKPETSYRYHSKGNPSVDSDKIPFIVIPGGGFNTALNVDIGDIAAVVYKGKVVFTLVADRGPNCKIGEGSIDLHEALNHKVCLARNSAGECLKLKDVGIDSQVLYFIFPKSSINGLTPENAKEKIVEKGKVLFDNLLKI